MKTWIAATVLLALGGAGLFWYEHRGTTAPQDGGFQMPPPLVEVIPVALGPVSRTVEAVGTLRANESVTIRPEIAGRVVAIGFGEGQKVRKGSTLITLDDSVYVAEVAEKAANRKLSELAFERAKLLVEKKAASIEVKDRAEAQLEADDAALQLARARLARTRILAPFDGVIGLRTVSIGDFVDVGEVLVNLVDIDLLKVDFRVGEVYLPDVTNGQAIAVKVDAFPAEQFNGEVYAIEPEVDVNGRAVVIRARLPNDQDKLRPGLFSRVTLIVDKNAQAMLVPEDAIVPQGDQHFIYRVVDGRVLLTEVQIGKRKDTLVEVRSGLSPTDVVVTAGQLKLRDGIAVLTTTGDESVAKAVPADAARNRVGCDRKRLMILSDISIRRPVLATVVNLIIVLLGLIAWDRLTIREFPNIDDPVVTVSTNYLGANAEIIESQVTKPLEDGISGIEGIDYISSISRAEQSQISVRFSTGRDPDDAANDVRDRVARARSFLPKEVDDPIVAKVESDATPIIYMAINSDRHDEMELSDYADRVVKDRLEVLPGVAQLLIFGERRYSMRIWLDRARLAAYSLTPADVERALIEQNVEVPAGRIESSDREFTVLSETDLRTPQQFSEIILKDASGYLVRLGDVAHVEIGPELVRNMSRASGRRAIGLGLIKQSTANLLDVAQGLRSELVELNKVLPEGMRVDIGFDSSIFVQESIDRVFVTILEAIALVVIVIFLFLRNWRATVVPLVTIPIALIGALALMWGFGFSINTLTLLAFVLAIGLVVDDAIVMLENIYRYIEQGMDPIKAAFVGSKQIGFAIVAMTFTLAAVFTPIAFSQGKTGKLFTEFALTLAGAVIVSGFVALTLSPMLASRLLRHETKHNAMFNLGERILNRTAELYRRGLDASLRSRPIVIVVMLLVGSASVLLYRGLPSELAPMEDQGTVMVFANAPEGATLDYLNSYTKKIDDVFKSIPEMQRYMMIMGRPTVSNMLSYTSLTPWNERDRTSQEVAADIMPKLANISGIRAFAVTPQSLGSSSGGGLAIQFVIQTSDSYERLDQHVGQILGRVANSSAVVNADTDLKLNKPELKVEVNRDKVASVGANVAEIGRTLETMLGGRQVTRFKRNAEQYNVKLQVADVNRRDPDDLTNIYVRGGSGQMIQLSNLVTVREDVAPRELNHFNKLRAARITASVGTGHTLGESLDVLESATREVMGPAAQIDYEGIAREFKESSSTIYLTFLLALAFIYLVLAAQFESFVAPFVIILSVPLAMAGALLALMVSGGSLNIYSQIGLITLVGLITKHGILIVEFSNQLRATGKPIMEAVLEASVMRLRPILMTTGAMVLGAVPLAMATGPGAEARNDIGWVIVGGMTVGTLFTLFVVPTVYTYLVRRTPRLVALQRDALATNEPTLATLR